MGKPSPWTGVLGAAIAMTAIALTMAARPAFAVQETKIGVTAASGACYLRASTSGLPSRARIATLLPRTGAHLGNVGS